VGSLIDSVWPWKGGIEVSLQRRVNLVADQVLERNARSETTGIRAAVSRFSKIWWRLREKGFLNGLGHKQ
jgi:hypothetical protein